ncbi:mycofactocin biosynthesis peptidyl-dipeptidase MftE [Solirubrobacter deserti]|uniref:Mycofactocin biosynthesis peptidyl-dipeptidase MftE n=1 Tax=Solirubrobacter deserti TaxID=2282478 RepID=A0ABT4RM06_9ACTN|nr:mycofactocin biosynthesis peptidyl-dipeptidase MftE [Solirubrobacter deserti]MDA0139597.1 mycofactocin biosynthesis peptidyl-dipeptidase MftE [Solirubrobacter deserti]
MAELASPAVTAAVAVVPLGATEQHGPHLPLGTDTTIACALAAGLAAARDDVVVAPALPYGSSGEHAGFAGTLSIGREALRLVLVQLARSWPGPMLFVCGHGGNAEPLAEAMRALPDARAWSPSFGGDAHAGRVETSLMLALAPELVGAARPAGATEPLASLMPALVAGGVRAVAPNGVLGDAAGASAGEGHALLARAVADLVAFTTAWLGGCGRKASSQAAFRPHPSPPRAGGAAAEGRP